MMWAYILSSNAPAPALNGGLGNKKPGSLQPNLMPFIRPDLELVPGILGPAGLVQFGI